MQRYLKLGAAGEVEPLLRQVFDAIRKDAPVVGGCREQNHDNLFNVDRVEPTKGAFNEKTRQVYGHGCAPGNDGDMRNGCRGQNSFGDNGGHGSRALASINGWHQWAAPRDIRGGHASRLVVRGRAGICEGSHSLRSTTKPTVGRGIERGQAGRAETGPTAEGGSIAIGVSRTRRSDEKT